MKVKKMRTRILCCLCALMLLVQYLPFVSMTASAAPGGSAPVYEPFDYAPGETLAGKNGGVGYSGAWRNDSTAGTTEIVAESLSYENLQTSGGALKVSVSDLQENPERERWSRDIEASLNIGKDGASWMSFLLKPEAVAYGENCAFVSNSLHAPFGKGWEINEFKSVNTSAPSLPKPEAGKTYLVVAKMVSADGVNKLYLWINPALGAGEPDEADAAVSEVAGGITSVLTGLGLGMQKAFNNTAYFDEMRAGDSFSAVTPLTTADSSSPVYEPFDYTAGETMAEKDGGTGFTGTWKNVTVSGTTEIMAESLSYENLVTSGGALKVSVAFGDNPEREDWCREIEQSLNIGKNGVAWMSYLLQLEDAVAEGENAVFFNNSKFTPIGKGWGKTFQVNSITSSSFPTPEANKTYLIVAKMVSEEGKNTLFMWVNPKLGAGEPDTADAAVYENGGVTSLLTGVGIGVQKHYGSVALFDEIRAGNTFSEVTPVEMPAAAPAKVTGLTASDKSFSTRIELNWTANSEKNVTYTVYRGDTNDLSAATKLGATTETSYTDSNVKANSSYYYWVSAQNLAGEGEKSDAVMGATKNPGEGLEVQVTPYPQSVDVLSQQTLTLSGKVFADSEATLPNAKVLAQELTLATGETFTAEIGLGENDGDINLSVDGTLEEEAYTLSTEGGVVAVKGHDSFAAAYGTSTLVQLCGGTKVMPDVAIADKPDSAYRAISLDVARRFTSIDAIKKIVDSMRMSKLNYLQLHLTDDQNWMMPVSAYPSLGQAGRNSSGKPAYTKEELIELEGYASSRGVRIIPEIDMPGHTSKMVDTYPEVFGINTGSGRLSCMNFAKVEARDATKAIIKEALEIFKSSPYYHLGGDEASYGGASADPSFQAAYTRLGVAANDSSNEEVFRDFICEMNDYVKAQGKQMIMWEGFPRNVNAKVKVPTDVMIINWEHIYYGIQEMLDDGYTIVNGSWHPYYVCDHYPGNNATYASPRVIYDNDKYTFRHNAPGYPGYAPEGLKVSPDSKVAGSMMAWWEGHEQNMVPMMRCRTAPFGAKLWNAEAETDYDSFAPIAERNDELVEKLSQPVKLSATNIVNKEKGQFTGTTQVTLSENLGGTIRYTINGDAPSASSAEYTAPISISSNSFVKAALFVNGKQVGLETWLYLQKVTLDDDDKNIAAGKPVTVEGDSFPNNPAGMITDGVLEPFSYWYGARNPQSVTIDLGSVQAVGSARVYSYWMQDIVDKFTVEISEDGESFTEVGDLSSNTVKASAAGYPVDFGGIHQARYVRINTLKNSGTWADCDKARLVEVKVYAEGIEPLPESKNMALGKPVTMNPPNERETDRFAMATDGIIDGNNYANGPDPGVGPVYIQIDLKDSKDIGKIVMRHYATGSNRTYHDVIIQLSDDPEFKTGVQTVFNNDTDDTCGQGAGTDAEYLENEANGTAFTFPTVKARYVRTWTSGFSTTTGSSRQNTHWQEVEVYAPEEVPLTAEVTATNGAISVQFNQGLAEMPTAADFTVNYQINGEAAAAQAVSRVTYNNNTMLAELTVPALEKTNEQQNVEVTVLYQGAEMGKGSFTVEAQAVEGPSAEVKAENGKIILAFDKALADTPSAADFTVNFSINGGAAAAQEISNVSYNSETKTATLTVPALEKGKEQQTVAVTVLYQEKELGSDTFTVDAAEPESLSTKLALAVDPQSVFENGVFTLSALVKENPGISEFALHISYDATKLEIVSDRLAPGAILSAEDLYSNLGDSQNTPKDNIKTITISYMGIEDFTQDGELFSVQMKALKGAAGMQDITMTCTSMVSSGEDGVSFQPVTADITNAQLSISKAEPIDKEIKSIAIKQNPAKTAYKAGEAFSPEGLVITVSYTDGTREDIAYSAGTAKDFAFDKTTLQTGDKAVNMTYGGKTLPITVTVEAIIPPQKEIKSIALITPPKKTGYVEGERFLPNGLAILVNYTDGTSEEVAYSSATAKYFTFDKTVMSLGDKAVTLEYGKKTLSIEVSVKAKTPAAKQVASISVKSMPNQTSYLIGDTFAPAGLVITVAYTDGTYEDVAYTDETAELFAFDKTALKAGDKVVRVTYGGKTVEIAIEVKRKTPEATGDNLDWILVLTVLLGASSAAVLFTRKRRDRIK